MLTVTDREFEDIAITSLAECLVKMQIKVVSCISMVKKVRAGKVSFNEMSNSAELESLMTHTEDLAATLLNITEMETNRNGEDEETMSMMELEV